MCKKPRLSDGLRRPHVARVDDVVEVVAHGNKQVEKELPAALAVHVAKTTCLCLVGD
jgi:hypothetical protein